MEKKRNKQVDVDVEEFSESVAEKIPDLAEINNYQKKTSTRRYLSDMGKKILPQIYKLLRSKNMHLRMEASKIIRQIGDKESIPILIDLLDDDEGSVRWIAAEGLVHIGRDSILPLLNKIVEKGNDKNFMAGARYALLRLFSEEEKEQFQPLLQSLKGRNFMSLLAPVEAFRALIIFKHPNMEKPKLTLA